MQFLGLEHLPKEVLIRIFVSGALTQHDLLVFINVGRLQNWIHVNHQVLCADAPYVLWSADTWSTLCIQFPVRVNGVFVGPETRRSNEVSQHFHTQSLR